MLVRLDFFPELGFAGITFEIARQETGKIQTFLTSISLKSATFSIWVEFGAIHMICGSLFACRENKFTEWIDSQNEWILNSSELNEEFGGSPTKKTINKLYELFISFATFLHKY